MKYGEIQADRVFPITEELREELERREQRRQNRYQNRESDWTRTGPLAKFWRLPEPLRSLALTVIHAAFLFWLLGYLILCTPGKRRKKRL